MVVYTRADCPICVYFKTVIRPMIEEEFGAVLAIEERDAAKLKLAVPLFFVSGRVRIGLASVATEEMAPKLGAAIQAALDQGCAPLGELGGFELVGFEEAES